MAFFQQIRKPWARLGIFTLCGLAWYVIGLPWIAAAILAMPAWLIIDRALDRLAAMDLRAAKASLVGPAGLALLFMLMLPLQKVVDNQVFYERLARFTRKAFVLRPAEFLDTPAMLVFIIILVFCAIFLIWERLKRVDVRPADPREGNLRGAFQVLGYALPVMISGSVFLYAYWPGILSPDSFAQWEQVDNLSSLYDWHPVVHTLLEYLLTRLWYSPAAMVVFQILALALLWGWMMVSFARQGLNRLALLALTCLFTLLPFNQILVVTLWKDILYAAVNMLLVFLLGQVWFSRGEWLGSTGNKILLGSVLAFTFLLRHNGLLALLLVPPVLLLTYPRRWRNVAVAALIAAALVLGIRNGIAFGLMKARPNDEAVAYVVPVQHIAAAAHAGVSFDPQDVAVLEQLAPLETWRKAYDPYVADTMTKPWGVMHDNDVLNKIGRLKGEILRIFLKTAFRHPAIVIRSELDLMISTWQISSLQGYTYQHQEYFTESAETSPVIKDPSIFIQPNQHSGIKLILDRYLFLTTASRAIFPLIWQGGFYLFITLMLGVMGFWLRGRDFLILLAPSLANLASLVVSMPVQNFRYVYPIVLSVFPIVLFVMLCRQPARDSRNAAASRPTVGR